jgi:hypothetical protein
MQERQQEAPLTTAKDVARIEGEIFGLKTLVANCLSFIAGVTDDPAKHLTTIQQNALAGIAEATNSDVKPQYLRHFQNAAAGVVAQLVDAAKTGIDPKAPRPKLQ